MLISPTHLRKPSSTLVRALQELQQRVIGQAAVRAAS